MDGIVDVCTVCRAITGVPRASDLPDAGCGCGTGAGTGAGMRGRNTSSTPSGNWAVGCLFVAGVVGAIVLLAIGMYSPLFLSISIAQF